MTVAMSSILLVIWWELSLLCSVSTADCINTERQCAYNNYAECKTKYAYYGKKAMTVSYRECQPWDKQEPHAHGIKLPITYKNYCRNPDGEPGPWCYTLDPTTRWELCFPDCMCIDESKRCAYNGKVECKASTAYSGTWNWTVSGRQCQRWDTTTPHNHGFGAKLGSHENHCRNPDGGPGPWCYTTDSEKRWELCFHTCTSCVDSSRQCAYNYEASCKEPSAYYGTKNTTVTGRQCQRWDTQTPHGHRFNDLPRYEENYCRNPDGEPGPWCYTTDPKKRWELCFPDCESCVHASGYCAYNYEDKCKTTTAYIGPKNTTVSGRVCKSWVEAKHPRLGISDVNYCRNPDSEPGPWCYTTDPKKRWELCFPDCSPCVDAERQCAYNHESQCKTATAYSGTKDKTGLGNLCQRWDVTSPQYHSYEVGGSEENYCRNPDKGPGPWCYTTNKDYRWQLCYPDCKVCVDPQKNCAYNGETPCRKETAYTGTEHTTVSGRECQRWDTHSPHKHDWYTLPSSEANYCRNPGPNFYVEEPEIYMEHGPWCYTTDPKKRWEFCFPDCHKPKCVDIQQECASHLGEPQCESKSAYDGTRNITASGRVCQRWDSQKPHGHVRNLLPSSEQNYCRNPDKEDGPWCYTTDPAKRWELCFPDCGSCVDTEKQCAHYGGAQCQSYSSYNGTKNTTASGIPCQRWDSQKTHEHSDSQLQASEQNFCRNTDGKAGPWCYTTDPETEWDYCFPVCSNRSDEPDTITTSVPITTTTDIAAVNDSFEKNMKILNQEYHYMDKTTKILTDMVDWKQFGLWCVDTLILTLNSLAWVAGPAGVLGGGFMFVNQFINPETTNDQVIQEIKNLRDQMEKNFEELKGLVQKSNKLQTEELIDNMKLQSQLSTFQEYELEVAVMLSGFEDFVKYHGNNTDAIERKSAEWCARFGNPHYKVTKIKEFLRTPHDNLIVLLNERGDKELVEELISRITKLYWEISLITTSCYTLNITKGINSAAELDFETLMITASLDEVYTFAYEHYSETFLRTWFYLTIDNFNLPLFPVKNTYFECDAWDDTCEFVFKYRLEIDSDSYIFPNPIKLICPNQIANKDYCYMIRLAHYIKFVDREAGKLVHKFQDANGYSVKTTNEKPPNVPLFSAKDFGNVHTGLISYDTYKELYQVLMFHSFTMNFVVEKFYENDNRECTGTGTSCMLEDHDEDDNYWVEGKFPIRVSKDSYKSVSTVDATRACKQDCSTSSITFRTTLYKWNMESSCVPQAGKMYYIISRLDRRFFTHYYASERTKGKYYASSRGYQCFSYLQENNITNTNTDCHNAHETKVDMKNLESCWNCSELAWEFKNASDLYNATNIETEVVKKVVAFARNTNGLSGIMDAYATEEKLNAGVTVTLTVPETSEKWKYELFLRNVYDQYCTINIEKNGKKYYLEWAEPYYKTPEFVEITGKMPAIKQQWILVEVNG